MSSRNKERKKIIVETEDILLKDFNFEHVEKDYRINERFYVDMIGVKDDKAVLIEVKPKNYKTDQSDVMQVSGYINLIKNNEDFKDKSVSGMIISSGATGSTMNLINELGICVTDSEKKEDIKKQISKCLP